MSQKKDIVMGLDLSATSSGVVVLEIGDSLGTSVQEAPFKFATAIENDAVLMNPWSAYLNTVERVLEIYEEHKPTVVAVESPLVVEQMSALLSGLYWQVMREIYKKQQSIVISMENSQLSAMFLKKRKLNKSQVVKHWKSEQNWAKGRWKADIVEAYYAAYYGVRFLHAAEEYVEKREAGRTYEEAVGGFSTRLHEKEQRIFFTQDLNSRKEKKGMFWRPGFSWFDWSNENLSERRTVRWRQI